MGQVFDMIPLTGIDGQRWEDMCKELSGIVGRLAGL